MNQLTIADVAKMVGISKATVSAHKARGTMPAPTGYLGATPYWSETVIRRWMIDRPTQGRPKQRKKVAK